MKSQSLVKTKNYEVLKFSQLFHDYFFQDKFDTKLMHVLVLLMNNDIDVIAYVTQQRNFELKSNLVKWDN